MEYKSRFFRAREISNGMFVISGPVGGLSFLILGSKKALLVDTMTGFGSLKAFCRDITDLPLDVVLTHGHVDHVGGNCEFDVVHIHPWDINTTYYQMTIAKRKAFLGEHIQDLYKRGITDNDLIPEKSFFAVPVYDGEYFDLGDNKVEVIHTPGHSWGSIALLNVNERIVLIGDNLNSGTLMFLESSTSVEEYLGGLEHLKSHAHRFDKMIWSHGDCSPLMEADLDDAIEACKSVLSGTEEPIPWTGKYYWAKKVGPDSKRLDGKYANFRYEKGRVHKYEISKAIVSYHDFVE